MLWTLGFIIYIMERMIVTFLIYKLKDDEDYFCKAA